MCTSSHVQNTVHYLSQDGATPLFKASQKGHSDTVTILITSGANINIPAEVYTCRLTIHIVYDGLLMTQDGTTPLFMASQNGHIDVVSILLRNNADVNLIGFKV